MAVLVNVRSNLNTFFDNSSMVKNERVEKSDLSSSFMENKMKAARKERRKPDMKIYHPKVRLNNKNYNTEKINGSYSKCKPEHQKPVTPTTDCILECENEQQGQVNEVDKIGSLNYTPKMKVFVVCEKKSESARSYSPVPLKGTDTHAKLSSRTNHLSYQKLAVKNISSKQFDSNDIESRPDLGEDFELSNLRSTPDDKMCNGHVKSINTHISSENALCMPEVYKEPLVWIHKRICNPSKPDVNIPLHISLTNMPYLKNYTTDSADAETMGYIQPPIMNSPYHNTHEERFVNSDLDYLNIRNTMVHLNSPTEIMGYIPPPQPLVMNSQFCYMHKEKAVNSNPDYLNTTGNVAYVTSPIETMGYISPPQPPATNFQYCYVRPEIADDSVPESYLYMRNGIVPPVQGTTVHDVDSYEVYSRSPVCYGDISPVLHETEKKKLRPIVEKNLKDISLLQRQLRTLLAKGFFNTNLIALQQCRWNVQLRYESIILADPKYCAETNVEQLLWKTCFYQVIELLWKKIDENPQDKEESQSILLRLISEGTGFYENLIEKQQETYGFNLAKFLEHGTVNAAHVPEAIAIVLISTKKILINIGDLERYKAQVSQTANPGEASTWYSKARGISPRNGIESNDM